MEAIIIVVAFGLIIGGVYGIVTVFRRDSLEASGEPSNHATFAAPPATVRALSPLPPSPRASLGGLFSEVDMLRAQIEHLRSEVVALSGGSARGERPQQRRYLTGPYAYLPRELRREVHKVRSIRHPAHT